MGKVGQKDMIPSLTWCDKDEVTSDKMPEARSTQEKPGYVVTMEGTQQLSRWTAHLFSTKHKRPPTLVYLGFYNKIPQIG